MASQLDYEKTVDKVPAFLPPFEGKYVLELGDGISCFCSELAKKKKAGNVDSIENVNKSINEHHENVQFMSVQVYSVDLNFPAESVDLIFSNWLSTRLSDIQIKDIAKKVLKWAKVGGYILFREPCFHQTGDDKQNSNTQDVHQPGFYLKVFKECHLSDESGNSFEFSLVGSKCIGGYELNKKNHNQIWWVWKKVNSKDDRGSQVFLDNVQYKNSAIQRYEHLFGSGFVCIGGIDTTKEFVAMLDLKPGQKVIDVGCGSGGSAFYMVDNFEIDVIGIDLSENMISLATERAVVHKHSVEFEVANCTKKSYPDNMFDVIYSRDTILHIQDKAALFRTFYKWLKPGGKVLITDYCGKVGTPSPDVEKFIKQLGYDLPDVVTYCQMLKDAGFQEVTIQNRTEQSKDDFQRHLERLEKEKEKLIGDFSEEEYNDFIHSWKENFSRIDSGEQIYAMFFAKKK